MSPDAILPRLHPSLRETFIPLEGTDIALHFPGGTEAVVRDLYRLASLTYPNNTIYREVENHAEKRA